MALRQSANVIGNLKEGHLNDFFRRINYKKGRATAISATARKLASRIRKNISKFDLKPEDIGFDKLLNTNMKV